MNKVKVFPLRLSQEFHQTIKKQAETTHKSIHQYVIDLIEEDLKNAQSRK
jgi:predicted HicB family RNase H-like nuclease